MSEVEGRSPKFSLFHLLTLVSVTNTALLGWLAGYEFGFVGGLCGVVVGLVLGVLFGIVYFRVNRGLLEKLSHKQAEESRGGQISLGLTAIGLPIAWMILTLVAAILIRQRYSV